jgi:hypothetical protein
VRAAAKRFRQPEANLWPRALSFEPKDRHACKRDNGSKCVFAYKITLLDVHARFKVVDSADLVDVSKRRKMHTIWFK